MKKQIFEILTNAFTPDVRVYKEALYMKELGYDVTILAWDREPEAELPAQDSYNGVNVVRFRFVSAAGRDSKLKKLLAYWKYFRCCKKYLKTHPCDYLHCNDNSGGIIGCFAKPRKLPMVIDMHEFFEEGGRLRRFVMRKINLFIFKRCIAGLYENAAYLEEPYKSVRDKLYPLRNYPDSGMVQCLPKSESDVFRIGFHGWVRPRTVEFEALFRAVKDMPDVRVDINGGGPGTPDVREIAKDYPNVFVNGPFDGTSALSGLYEKTDLLFCGYDPDDPNYQGDAEIVKFYEGIVTGTPMLMTESLGMGQKVRDNGWGLTCDTRDTEQIRKAVLTLKDDKAFWKQCAENELKSAPNYRWEEAVKILGSIYPDNRK